MCRTAGRLYNAAIKDRAFTYAWFFLMFAAHIIFCIWSAVSPPLPLGNAWSHTGFILGVQARAGRLPCIQQCPYLPRRVRVRDERHRPLVLQPNAPTCLL